MTSSIVIANAPGGLSRPAYLRHFVFGLLFTGPALAMASNAPDGIARWIILVIIALNTVLYPHCRFAYEAVVDFIVGRNMFILPAVIALPAKLMTMGMCWGLPSSSVLSC